ncbi:M10 family metallopeptidase C-terminal domain-containing protein [Xenorhabdus miraniensis]|uniref:Alkaline metalloproteinase n=1 Tax=Xenorhabdus miraniensis TaxID=351674 RepID=A0A2D0JS22_9GAMM|nr:M10 family metallopeptidase C-terminal domain-containing protein [Xenorhabdus miraniensis]PHM48659.1 alkaline metalloproteinase precursor [Xenorhabdus miraniensis]PHM48992.1 alkaline metalloproteinase precursor [Xenorhabdus miraniensis]
MSLSKKEINENEVLYSYAVKQIKKYLDYYNPSKNKNINKYKKPIYGDKSYEKILRKNFIWKNKKKETLPNEPVQFKYCILTSKSKFAKEPAVKKAMEKAKVAELATIDMDIKEALDKSYESWSRVANISFTEVYDYDKADLVVCFYSKNIKKADLNPFTKLPTKGNYKSHSWFNMNNDKFSDKKFLEVNRNIRKAFVHEIGHQLSLIHPSPYDAGDKEKPNYEKSASHFEDSFAYTVMSYFNSSYTGQDFEDLYPSCPVMNDISAVQKLYGLNSSNYPTYIVYGFNSNTGLDYETALHKESKLIFCACPPNIISGKEIEVNRFDFSGFVQDQVINLNEGAFSDVGGLKGNVSIARGCTIHEAIGGRGNDIIIGNNVPKNLEGTAGNNILYSGFGGGTIRGGTGKNTFVYLSGNQSIDSSYDTILDFESGKDKVDLSGFDFGGTGKVKFVERHNFGQPGDAYFIYQSIYNSTSLYIKLGKGMVSDMFMLVFIGIKELTESDFIL